MFDELIPFVMVLRNKHNTIHLYLLVPLPLTVKIGFIPAKVDVYVRNPLCCY